MKKNVAYSAEVKAAMDEFFKKESALLSGDKDFSRLVDHDLTIDNPPRDWSQTSVNN